MIIVSESASLRKSSIKIVENIFQALDDGKFHTISDISRISRSNWRTIKNQVELIKKIQELPKIEILHASKQVLVRKVDWWFSTSITIKIQCWDYYLKYKNYLYYYENEIFIFFYI